MTIQGKEWGVTNEFFRNAISSAHHLSIKKGGFSSIHFHKHKYNLFYVISGKLQITIWQPKEAYAKEMEMKKPSLEDLKNKYLKDITVIGSKQISAIPSDFIHQFESLEDTECIEVYQVILGDPDIERLNQGGLKGGDR